MGYCSEFLSFGITDIEIHLERYGETRFIGKDIEEYKKNGLINFIDHPGLGWHNFPHPGIERQGISCGLNLFYHAFLVVLAQIAESIGARESEPLALQAERLAQSIRQTFYDGQVFHDAVDPDTADERGKGLSHGTSWQTNALAVYFDMVRDGEAKLVMQSMLERYDSVCRCSPYFFFFFLPALRKTGMHQEAIDLIKHEWRPMLDGDATTTWEGFVGDDKDSLCHPWSTAPYLYLLESSN